MSVAGEGLPGGLPGGLPADEAAYVDLVRVSKHFGGVQALKDVSLRIRRGTVHAVIGENGAGKSTLTKLLSGVLSPDAGEIRIGGVPTVFHSPRDALAHGIATISQEGAVVPGLSVAQNVFLGVEPRRLGFVQRKGLQRRFDELCASVEFDLRADDVVGRLRTPDRQKTEVLRAIATGASLVIMDEPSATLARPDAERLHEVIRSLVRGGRTVLLVSHILSEVLSLADEVTILRDGRLIRTGPADQETESSLIAAMLGRSLGSVFPDKPEPPTASPVVLQVDGLSAPGVRDASFTVRAGEIVGIAGLVGAGRSELAMAIYGAARMTAGSVSIAGAPARRLRSPAAARAQGLFMIPESRKEQGLLLQRSARENVTLANMGTFSARGTLKVRQEKRAAASAMAEAGVVGGATETTVSLLSGGNQQKVLFARGMLCGPKVLIADEPTRGVDVGSRRKIYEIINERAAAGVGVVIISSDIEEVLGLAHRVLVMAGGRLVAELAGDEMTELNVLTAAFQES